MDQTQEQANQEIERLSHEITISESVNLKAQEQNAENKKKLVQQTIASENKTKEYSSKIKNFNSQILELQTQNKEKEAHGETTTNELEKITDKSSQ